MAYCLIEANNCHGVHCVSESLSIINISQAEGLTARKVVEGTPPSLKPAAMHLLSQCLRSPLNCPVIPLETCAKESIIIKHQAARQFSACHAKENIFKASLNDVSQALEGLM